MDEACAENTVLSTYNIRSAPAQDHLRQVPRSSFVPLRAIPTAGSASFEDRRLDERDRLLPDALRLPSSPIAELLSLTHFGGSTIIM